MESAVQDTKKFPTAYMAAALLLVAGLGLLVFSGLSENSVYFLNVSEALAMEQGKLAQARLFGTVAEQDLTRFQDTPGVRFQLQDKDNPAKTIRVEYRGAVPDTFKPGAEVIVEGGMAAGADTFGAKVLMTKCPSKYQKESRKG